jgi:hypothetical protein
MNYTQTKCFSIHICTWFIEGQGEKGAQPLLLVAKGSTKEDVPEQDWKELDDGNHLGSVFCMKFRSTCGYVVERMWITTTC